MARLNKTPLLIRAKRGLASQVTASSPAPYQKEGEMAYSTDTKSFYISDGTAFRFIGDGYNSFASFKNGVEIYKSGSTVLDIQGSQGQLFSVVDSLTGSLMSVNDVSGLPILEVFSNDTVVMGTYGNPALIISGSVANVTGSLVTQGQTIDPALIWFMS
jgi:hypothetical protein